MKVSRSARWRTTATARHPTAATPPATSAVTIKLVAMRRSYMTRARRSRDAPPVLPKQRARRAFPPRQSCELCVSFLALAERELFLWREDELVPAVQREVQDAE